MRTNKELQEWLDNNPILIDELVDVKRWLLSQGFLFRPIYVSNDGLTLIDIIDFVNSPSPSKEKDLSPIVAQFAKVKKEVSKLEKLINKL